MKKNRSAAALTLADSVQALTTLLPDVKFQLHFFKFHNVKKKYVHSVACCDYTKTSVLRAHGCRNVSHVKVQRGLNEVLRKTFGPQREAVTGGWEKLQIGKL